MLITLKADVRPPTAPILGSPTVLGTTSMSVPLQTAATDVNGIASYTLEYSTSLGGSYVVATAAAIFPEIVTGLSPSTQYYFRARAVDNYGNEGPNSGVVSATTQAVDPGTSLSWPLHVPGYISLIPGVGGYGMNTVAGSGRHLGTPATTIILINSLATGNTGSAAAGLGANVFQGTWEYAWRHAASPKVIIPIISGWVPVQDSVPCQTGTPPRPGYVSYYGQGAPNPGLWLRGCNAALNGASNVAVWHLRSYMGDDVTGVAASGRDCLSSGYGGGTTQQIVLINCEFAWSVDEIVDFYRSHNQLTFVNCAFIEPLHLSTIIHPEDGPGVDHGFGPIIGGDTGQAQPSAVSSFRNLWAHTTGRNPLVTAETFVHANNLHYNHGRPTGGSGNAVQIIGAGATAANFANILGNGFVRGPNNNTSMVAVTVASSMPAGSAGYSFANSQFGWTAPANQNAFFTTSPSGYAASTVQASAYPGSWGSGLTAVLQWAANPLAPTLTEWSNYVTLMERTVGAQPRWRTTQYGRVSVVFNQVRDRLNGVTQTDQFVDTVTEAGGWFTVPSVTINPLNPGSHWHAPLPTGADRDTPYTSGTFSDGKSRVGYTRLEEWGYEQHLYVTSFDTVAPTVPASVLATAQSSSTIRITWSASTDVGGVGVAGYRVYRSTSAGGPFSQIGGDITVGTLQYDDSGLSASTTRYYSVSAFDWAGNESNTSAVTNATTFGLTVTRLPFSDGFESGSLSAWDIVGGVVSISTTQAYSGIRSASTLAINGQQSDNYLEYNFGDASTVGGTPTGTNELWIQFAHKWDSAYVDTGVSNQKLLLLNSHNPASGRRRYQVTFNYSQPSAGYFFEFFRWNEDTSFGGSTHANIVMSGFPRVKGRWEEFVFRIRMNTIGVSDGILEVWTKAEGDTLYTQRISQININYRESATFTPNRLIGLSNYDTITTRSGSRYWDGIYIGQTAVDVSAPASNDGVVVSNFATFDPDAAQIISLDINNTLSTATSTGASVTFANEAWWNGTTGVATIRPPTIADGYAGINNINIWKNATKQVRQYNIRWECRASDLFCANATGMPKWIIVRTARSFNIAASLQDRPMLYINHMDNGEGTPSQFQIADCLVFCPAQGTVRMYSSQNFVPAVLHSQQDGSTISGNASMRQPMYVRATAGVDGAGNPIVDADEHLCVEMRVNVMSTSDEPNGVIGVRIHRRSGLALERVCAWTYWPNSDVTVNTNYIADIDVMGGGYFNNANNGDSNRWIKLGRRLTMAFNLQPTVGRAWIGPPSGFVTG